MAKIKRKKVPVQGGRAYALPPLDAAAEHHRSSLPELHEEDFSIKPSTTNEKAPDFAIAKISPPAQSAIKLENKSNILAMNENRTEEPSLRSDELKAHAVEVTNTEKVGPEVLAISQSPYKDKEEPASNL